ncbi:MAG: DUF5320 domain-containing protein [Methanomassiliicoccales archaeon]|nr:DUF5320 domain-containing protein [Methanomassiliicoccales archaeon]
MNMPNQDGTGPTGSGPRGRRLGPCSAGTRSTDKDQDTRQGRGGGRRARPYSRRAGSKGTAGEREV